MIGLLQACNSGDGCDLVLTLGKYDLSTGDLFLLLPLVSRCLETIDVCIWHMFIFMSVVVTV